MEAHDEKLAPEVDEHAGEQQPDAAGAETSPVLPPQPDPTSERSSGDTPAPPESSPSASEQTSPEDASSPSDQTESSSEDSSDQTRETSSSESATSSDELPSSEREESAEEDEGLLVGTGAEEAPGTGSGGTHPAPAAMRDPERGGVHVAGEPPAGTVAPSGAPSGDTFDERSGDDVDPEARDRLNEVTEPEQIHTDRPDLGTE